jgi:cellulose synthase/poly-beta-1,6-N-acetylglucosamine synthase-like glycosyltransferase
MIRASCNKPFFSVVIPLYNKARSVARAVHSVPAQDFGDFELLVVNDGSTDAGPGVVASMNDSRLRCINQPNSGVWRPPEIGALTSRRAATWPFWTPTINGRQAS